MMPADAKQLVVVSGKGGTGKTTVLASFASLAGQQVLADCDVDAANLYLLLHPEARPGEDCQDAKVAVRDAEACTGCGECERRCRFGAITVKHIKESGCEGCGLCVLACPTGALSLQLVTSGTLYTGATRYGPMVHARLVPGGESSGRLVSRVRQRADEIAREQGSEWILLDGPPGIGCTATSALVDTDMAVVVTEPTLSGMHDMERVVALVRHFGVPISAIINKHDINPENTSVIEGYCRDHGLPVLALLPFDDVVVAANAAQAPLVEFDDGPVSQGIREAWKGLSAMDGPHNEAGPSPEERKDR